MIKLHPHVVNNAHLVTLQNNTRSHPVSVTDPFIIIKKLSGFGDLPVHCMFLRPHSGAHQKNFITGFKTTTPTAKVVKFLEVTECF